MKTFEKNNEFIVHPPFVFPLFQLSKPQKLLASYINYINKGVCFIFFLEKLVHVQRLSSVFSTVQRFSMLKVRRISIFALSYNWSSAQLLDFVWFLKIVDSWKQPKKYFQKSQHSWLFTINSATHLRWAD